VAKTEFFTDRPLDLDHYRRWRNAAIYHDALLDELAYQPGSTTIMTTLSQLTDRFGQ
jgi:hypothetical protein